jgi:hypothetical protein
MVREDAEALRRRLYAPGASDADRARYAALGAGDDAAPAPVEHAPVEVSAAPVDAAPGTPPPASAPARRRRARTLIIGAAVVVALIVGGITAARLAADGRPSGPPPTPIAMTDEDRQSLRDNLTVGGYAGIAAYLLTHRVLPLTGATRIDPVEGKGVGKGVVSLSPVSPETVRGRATVLFVTAGAAEVTWTTLRRKVDASGEQLYVSQVQRSGFQQGGQLTTHMYRYASGDRPVELRVDVPDGVRWGAAVVFSD